MPIWKQVARCVTMYRDLGDGEVASAKNCDSALGLQCTSTRLPNQNRELVWSSYNRWGMMCIANSVRAGRPSRSLPVKGWACSGCYHSCKAPKAFCSHVCCLPRYFHGNTPSTTARIHSKQSPNQSLCRSQPVRRFRRQCLK